jgi:hypothetical protein
LALDFFLRELVLRVRADGCGAGFGLGTVGVGFDVRTIFRSSSTAFARGGKTYGNLLVASSVGGGRSDTILREKGPKWGGILQQIGQHPVSPVGEYTILITTA